MSPKFTVFIKLILSEKMTKLCSYGDIIAISEKKNKLMSDKKASIFCPLFVVGAK